MTTPPTANNNNNGSANNNNTMAYMPSISGVPPSVMCSLPPPAAAVGADQWSAAAAGILATPHAAAIYHHHYGYHQSMTPYMMNGFNGMPMIGGPPQMSPYFTAPAPATADINGMVNGHQQQQQQQQSVVPSSHQRYGSNNCDINGGISGSQQQQHQQSSQQYNSNNNNNVFRGSGNSSGNSSSSHHSTKSSSRHNKSYTNGKSSQTINNNNNNNSSQRHHDRHHNHQQQQHYQHNSNNYKNNDNNRRYTNNNNRHRNDSRIGSKYNNNNTNKSIDRNNDKNERYRESVDQLSEIHPPLKRQRVSNNTKTTTKEKDEEIGENSGKTTQKQETTHPVVSTGSSGNVTTATTEQVLTQPVEWMRCSPADLFYEPQRTADGNDCSVGTKRMQDLRDKFRYDLLERSRRAIQLKPKVELPARTLKLKPSKTCLASSSDSSSCCDSDSNDDDDDDDDCEDTAFEELQRKKRHPLRLHEELWYNDPGEMNDGPLCRCSSKARKTGIRHGIYPGEQYLPGCNPNSNNRHRLHHYRISITPQTNFLTKFPTTIGHDGHDFIFEGYSLLSHWPLTNPIACKVIRFNIEYTVTFVEEKFPDNFNVLDLDYFQRYVFFEILELVDLDFKAYNNESTADSSGNDCPRFHFMPRFARLLQDNGKELLSMNVVLQYLLNQSNLVIDDNRLEEYKQMADDQWTDYAKQLKGMIVTCPGMKPSSLRVDQIDRESDDLIDNTNNNNQKSNDKDSNSCSDGDNDEDKNNNDSDTDGVVDDDGYPVIVHFGIRPPQLSYAGNPKYQKAWRDYVKFRHLLANKKKVSYTDKQTLLQKEEKLQEMRMKSDLKRDVTVVLNSKGFYTTGLQCDIIQHSLLLPVLVCHLRFHQSLQYLESIIGYTFADRYLLQLALTHPSYRENFGTNPDHARNALTNCGIRQPQYGDRRVHFMNTRKRGINMLINIMSRFGCNEETVSNINHNERLEFLGDAVVEFMSSIHLYFMFPDLEEGGLATYRAALVQNQQLAVLAKKLQLEKFMLYAHGSDLCHDLELRHAMANCFEALMGALFLDGGIEVADRVFSNTLFADENQLLDIWINYPRHPLQRQEVNGDRQYIETIPRLKELTKFEDITGIEFTHIRLLARAFTHRSVGFNNLTLGSNQRMEFLGDTVLQLVASEYLYKYFPEHHEGHLSLLRSSLVNNKTQAVVCDDLAMTSIAIYNFAKGELKTKDRADLLEAFLGALYVDKGLPYCRLFCEVCFFPRLEHFIMNQDWNDPKSKLQQCCLTLRSVDGGEPDIPIYKVIECRGPTNTRVYVVAVYFRDQRLATGTGHSIQEAEMSAASNALESSRELFPQLNHQKKVIERSVKSSIKTQTTKSSTKDNHNKHRRHHKYRGNHCKRESIEDI